MSREEANRIVRAVERARRSRRAALKVALPTAAALGAGAAIAIGSIPSGDGTITGCYVTAPNPTSGFFHYGQLRVIDPSQPPTLPTGGPNEQGACLNGEATITWNQRGPQGPQGAQGVPGPAGASGAPGSPLIGSTSFGFSGGGRTFLKLDGVKGESTDKAHKGEIDISSFSIGANGGTHASGGGGGAGKVTFSSFTITKRIDKASPLLFRAAATGQHYKEAVVSFARKAGGKQLDYLEYKMSQVLISSFQDGGSQSQVPTEQISFSFAKIEEIFLGSNGKPIQKISINVGAQNKGS
ncbi:MAG TPA: type VI secretion system tube protein TssD [Conexibacter sp.]|jgi:type VI secretion system secreted protein Hcp|nr:type VI secretion system tube protein TssD [Conexibacter sp.]